MKLTIIPIDGAVYKDGVSYINLDLSSAPANVHALQFNDAVNAGWIEFVEDDFGNKPVNQPITSLPEWAITAMTKWDEAKVIDDATIVAANLAKVAADQPKTNA